MAVWFSNIQSAVSKLLRWPRAASCALLENFKQVNPAVKNTSGFANLKRLQITDLGEKNNTSMLGNGSPASRPAKWICLWSLVNHVGCLFNSSPFLKMGANRFVCLTYGRWGELITWGQDRPFELVRDAEVLSGIKWSWLSVLIWIFYLWVFCDKPSTQQRCCIDKSGSWLGLGVEMGCCAGNLCSGSIQHEIFCPEHIGKWFLKACDILQ